MIAIKDTLGPGQRYGKHRTRQESKKLFIVTNHTSIRLLVGAKPFTGLLIPTLDIMLPPILRIQRAAS